MKEDKTIMRPKHNGTETQTDTQKTTGAIVRYHRSSLPLHLHPRNLTSFCRCSCFVLCTLHSLECDLRHASSQVVTIVTARRG